MICIDMYIILYIIYIYRGKAWEHVTTFWSCHLDYSPVVADINYREAFHYMRTEAATPKFGVEARPWVTPALKHAFKEKHFKALARSSMKQKGIKGT